jgi:oleate hydratase
MAAMTEIQRTPGNQYESIVLPLCDWLRRLGVQVHTGTTVTDIDFVPAGRDITARRLHLAGAEGARTIALAATDLVFVTNGSHVAAASRGSMASAPPPPSPQRDVSWQLWERLARKQDDFGRPAAFNANAAHSSWVTFTVTSRGSLFVDRLKDLTGSAAGRGGLITLTDSNWLVTIVTLRNPHFAGQPENVHVWWGYGLYLDRPGNFVPKPMPACTGAEILDETVRHLGFDADLESIAESSICIPCLLPYAASCLLPRSAGDRPPVVPRRSTNLAFIGQFAEIPDEAAFTTEYAVRTAQTAVAILLKRDMPPPVYKGQFDPGVLLAAAKALRS